jgi:protein phosphatase
VELKFFAATDIGRQRDHNEDNYLVDPQLHLFVVADGMGGHAAGEVASEMAVQIVARHLLSLTSVLEQNAAEKLAQAMRDANRAIYDRMLAEVDKQGMGTTASVLVVSDNQFLIGQIGDSRIYLLRDGALTQLTKDHSYVQEQVDAGLLTPEQARYHPYSNVITRCVGASETVEADIYAGEMKPGDVYLLASDGLTGMVDDRRLQQMLLARSGPGRIVDALIAEANGRGGLDNITAIVIQVVGVDTPAVEAHG